MGTGTRPSLERLGYCRSFGYRRMLCVHAKAQAPAGGEGAMAPWLAGMSIYGSSEPLIRRGQKQHEQGNQFHRVNQTVKRYPGNRVLLEALNEMWRRNGNPQEANSDKEPPRPVLPKKEKPKPKEESCELKPEVHVSHKNAPVGAESVSCNRRAGGGEQERNCELDCHWTQARLRDGIHNGGQPIGRAA